MWAIFARLNDHARNESRNGARTGLFLERSYEEVRYLPSMQV